MAPSDRSHYDVLGISRDADAAMVRTAWKLHVQAWHPDRFTGEMREEAERQASRINEAYTTLRDQSRRAAYDCRLAAEESASRPQTEPRRARVQPMPPRAPSAPIGTPMEALQPATTCQQAAAMARDAIALVRQHPRVLGAAAAVWIVVFGASAVLHVIAGPSLPSGPALTRVAASSPSADQVVAAEETDDLAELAAQARAEALRAEAEMEQLLREEQAAAIAAERAAAAAAQRSARRPQPRRAVQAPEASGGRVVRVMPSGG